jgi:hypothetical protein
LKKLPDGWRNGKSFVVRDLPWTEDKLRKMPHFEFENWAVIALGGIPNKVQVGDMGERTSAVSIFSQTVFLCPSLNILAPVIAICSSNPMHQRAFPQRQLVQL